MHDNYIFSVLLATSSAHLEDLAYLDEQRHTPLRTSLRMPRQSMGGIRTQQDLRGKNTEGYSGAWEQVKMDNFQGPYSPIPKLDLPFKTWDDLV